MIKRNKKLKKIKNLKDRNEIAKHKIKDEKIIIMTKKIIYKIKTNTLIIFIMCYGVIIF